MKTETDLNAYRHIRRNLTDAIRSLSEAYTESVRNPGVTSAEALKAINDAGHLLNKAANDLEGRLVHWG